MSRSRFAVLRFPAPAPFRFPLLVLTFLPLLFLARAGPASAQSALPPAGLIEATGGYLGFVDEAFIDHSVLAGSARVYVTRRVAVGPEVSWLRGPDIDRDWVLTGNVTIDLLVDRRDRARQVVPYVVAGGGWTWTTLRVGTGPYSTSEVALTGGGGARISVAGRWYVAPELRIGWEAHLRGTVAVGYRLR